MSDKAMLFSAEMVQAILDGRKTMTRRVITPEPNPQEFAPVFYKLHPTSHPRTWWCFADSHLDEKVDLPLTIGDNIWVKETWRTEARWDRKRPRDLPPAAPVHYVAEGQPALNLQQVGKTRPSIFMPRWASRITLIVDHVRIERLSAITEKDAKAEGVKAYRWQAGRSWGLNYRQGFFDLWDSLNAERGYGTGSDPFVMVATFRAFLGNIDAPIQDWTPINGRWAA